MSHYPARRATNREGATAMNASKHARDRAGGQVLVILAAAMVALIAITGLVIDGGNAWAQERMAQNASDAAAEAGAVVVAQYYAGASAPATGYAGTCPTVTADPWDAAVCTAVYGAGVSNDVTVTAAYYTSADGSTNVGTVGGGVLPTTAQGVRVASSKHFSTYLIGVVGIKTLDAGSNATAVVGTISTFCPPDTICGTLPIAVPVQAALCTGSGTLQIGTGDWQITSDFTTANESIVPLCKTGPGSVGWLQWPCETQNGTPGLEHEINSPCIQNLTLPQWVPTFTGNTNASSVEGDLNAYHNKVVLIPQYDNTQGNGNNLEYHVTQFHAFLLDYAYTSSNNHPECNSAPGSPFVGGNGSTGCLKGWWTETILTGSVTIGGITPGTDEPLGVQLIK
jgi:Flp pilus assembly protein TadG